jgi:adenylate kinase
MDTAHQAGIAGMGMYALKLYYDTDESHEGKLALKEKRQPNFRFPQATQTRLGSQGLTVSAMGFGCMGITAFYGAPMKDEDALTLLRAVYSKGCNFFDTAEMYRTGNPFGAPTKDTQFNETILGKFVQQVPRASVVIATKFAPGMWGGRVDLQTVERALDASLQRLGVACVDLYYCHRMPASLAGLLEWMHSAAALVKKGKVKFIGLSEVSGEWLREAHRVFPVSCVQQEWSLMTRSPVEDDLVPVCAELGIGVVAYSPLARNLLTEQQAAPKDFRASNPRFSKENFAQNQDLTKKIGALAKDRGSAAQLSLAWLYQRARELGVTMVAIPGSTKIPNAVSNLESLQVRLSVQEMQLLGSLAGKVQGARGNPQYLQSAVEGQRSKMKPRAVIVAGAPASGKGTQCEKLVAKYKLVHISSGDILRARQSDDKELKSFMDQGLLVPDALVIRLIKERMQQPDVLQRGALLDGFPRTVAQARVLADSVDVQLFLFVDVPEEVVIARISGRRIDPLTNDVYHIKTKPPPPDVAKRVVIRGDDTPDAIKTRLQKFRLHTKDVLAFYSKVVVHLDAGSKTPDQVFALIEQQMDKPKARL